MSNCVVAKVGNLFTRRRVCEREQAWLCCLALRTNAMKRIQIIEDDPDIVELVRYNLIQEGFQISANGDGVSGMAQLRKAPPDLLILDLMLPKLSGLEICREIRRDRKLERLPVIMLTARGEEADRVSGLELGADDYVTKPFSPRELVARVKALLRRAQPVSQPEQPIQVGSLHIDPGAFRVTRDGENVPLTALEFRLLYFLARELRLLQLAEILHRFPKRDQSG